MTSSPIDIAALIVNSDNAHFRDVFGTFFYYKVLDMGLDFVGDITGMLLEFDMEDIVRLVIDEDYFHQTVRECYDAYGKSFTN